MFEGSRVLSNFRTFIPSNLHTYEPLPLRPCAITPLFLSCIKNRTPMIGKYKIVTLCGSTKFRDEFLAVQKRLTLEGNIVISVGLFGHSGDEEVWSETTKEMLDDMHLRKIDLADEIFIINKEGYIGNSTRKEIEYANKNGKGIKYMEPVE